MCSRYAKSKAAKSAKAAEAGHSRAIRRGFWGGVAHALAPDTPGKLRGGQRTPKARFRPDGEGGEGFVDGHGMKKRPAACCAMSHVRGKDQ